MELLLEGTLDNKTYKAQADRLDAEIIVKRLELNEAEMEGFDIEAALNFAEGLILNAERLWIEANLDQKQRLQKVFFPEGMTFLNGNFGTTRTCLFFNHLQVLETPESNLAPQGSVSTNPARIHRNPLSSLAFHVIRQRARKGVASGIILESTAATDNSHA